MASAVDRLTLHCRQTEQQLDWLLASVDMSRKENALDLAKFVDKAVRVKLSGGREGVDWSPSNADVSCMQD